MTEIKLVKTFPGAKAEPSHLPLHRIQYEGLVRADVGGEFFEVGPGDSIHFDPSIPHRWIAAGEKPAQAVVVAIIPERLQGDLMDRITNSMGTKAIAKSGIDALADNANA